MDFLAFSDIWDWIELAATILGILYVIKEVQQRVSMWYFNIFCAALYVAIGIHQYLWGSVCLNVYYIIMAFLGIYRLTRDKAKVAADPAAAKSHDIVVRPLSLRTLVISLAVFALSSTALFFVFRSLDDPRPVLDSVTMTLSIVGTYWLTRSYIEVWFVWIISDVLQIAMYALQGMPAPALMFVVYLAASVYGYIHWRKNMTVID
jgi:nicotinamide mononucleotide transporter